MGEKRRTVCDGRHEAVYWDGPVEDHLGRHGLLAHEVAIGTHTEREKFMSEFSSKFIREKLGMTDLRTRASEVRPAIAMPTWSSMRNIFCWYDASSPLER